MLGKDHKSADFIYLFSEKISHKFFLEIFCRLPLSPNQITLINFFFNNLAAVFFFSLGKTWANWVALFFLASSAIWDWMDGEKARKKKIVSKQGIYLDAALDFVWQKLLIAGISVGVYLSSGKNFLWLVVGSLALVSLVFVNYLSWVFETEFGFGFRGDYEEFFKRIDSAQKKSFFDKFSLEILTFRKFIFIFFFTIRYPLLLGAIFNRLNLFLIFLIITSLVRGIWLFYLYFIFLESRDKRSEMLIIQALNEREKFWAENEKQSKLPKN